MKKKIMPVLVVVENNNDFAIRILEQDILLVNLEGTPAPTLPYTKVLIQIELEDLKRITVVVEDILGPEEEVEQKVTEKPAKKELAPVEAREQVVAQQEGEQPAKKKRRRRRRRSHRSKRQAEKDRKDSAQ